MFDIHFFRKDTRPFFKFAKEIYPGQFHPYTIYSYIKLLEDNKLLRNYTQNIDPLEETRGIRNVITCYGSFATASCTICHYQVWRQRDQGRHSQPDHPVVCQVPPRRPGSKRDVAVMKPAFVFSGEDLSQDLYCEAVN